MEKNRFKQLLESTIGNSKPLLAEHVSSLNEDGFTNPVKWAMYSCVTGSTGAQETKLSDGDTSYTINDVTYYNNGRKLMPGATTMVTYTCNDPEFKAQGDVAPTGNYVQQAQALLGIPQAEQDGKFGPKTLQALKTKLGVS